MSNLEIGELFQEETKYQRDKLLGEALDWDSRPQLHKTYTGCPKHQLPTDFELKALSLDQSIKQRKSVRQYSWRPVPLEMLSYLLWASTGSVGVRDGHERRTAPSAGALYPIETYLVVNNVESIPQGIYHYSIRGHCLECLKTGARGTDLEEAALGQDMCRTAPVVFVWSAMFERTVWKYKQRGYRYIYLDCGHIAQNLALAAVSIGLGSCQMAALFDDEVNEVIGLHGTEESVIYMSSVGFPPEPEA